MNPLLLIDTNYLCHRAYHAMGTLTHEDAPVGAIYGVLRDIVMLQELFQSTRCVFAFDPGTRGKRQDVQPGYKAGRRARHAEETPEEKRAREGFNNQVVLLREEYLPAAGFRNVFCEPGYEADDILASIAMGLPAHTDAAIVGADQDLWQCLRPNVWCYNPSKKQNYTIATFRREWGLEPHQWADVKAYAGCSSDDVVGLPGVGEKKAAEYLRGTMNPKTKTYAKLQAGRAVHDANLPLVKLPYPGTPTYRIEEDQVTEEKWQELARGLGMHSIRSTVPRGAAPKRRGRRRGSTQEGFGL